MALTQQEPRESGEVDGGVDGGVDGQAAATTPIATAVEPSPSAETTEAEPETGTTSVWRNLDFVKLWTGETVSLIGTQITVFALPSESPAPTDSRATALK